MREAWFSALGERIRNGSIVDLFAGSGALGIEALSRGAAIVHFVEADRRAYSVLERNIESLDLGERARLHREDVFRFLSRLSKDERYDIALADPPYGTGAGARLVEEYRRRPFAGLLCLEHRTGERPDPGAVWERRYGDTKLSFFEPPRGEMPGER